MYLSHFSPDQKNIQAITSLENVHRAVWRFFHFDREAQRSFLYRQEGNELVVVSQVPPLPRLPGWTSRVRRFEPRFRAGEEFLFKVRVNPTVASKGKRFDRIQRRMQQEPGANLNHIIAKEGRDWLASREEALGFRCLAPGPLVGDYRQHRFHKLRQGRPVGRAVILGTLELSGVAVVTDPQRFRQCLTEGIGHGKGYGCGLMLTQPFEEATS